MITVSTVMYIFLLDFISFSCIFLYFFAGLFFKNLNMRNMTDVVREVKSIQSYCSF